MFYIYYIQKRIVRQLVHFISKMSTSKPSKQPAEKRRRTDNDSDDGGIHNFLKKIKKKNKVF